MNVNRHDWGSPSAIEAFLAMAPGTVTGCRFPPPQAAPVVSLPGEAINSGAESGLRIQSPRACEFESRLSHVWPASVPSSCCPVSEPKLVLNMPVKLKSFLLCLAETLVAIETRLSSSPRIATSGRFFCGTSSKCLLSSKPGCQHLRSGV